MTARASLVLLIATLSACGTHIAPRPTPTPAPSTLDVAKATATCERIWQEELLRPIDRGPGSGLDGCLQEQRGGRGEAQIRAEVKASKEWAEVHRPKPVPTVRPGRVFLCGDHGLCDGAGRHYYGGVNIFWAAWGLKNDKVRLDAALQDVAPGKHDLARVFGHITGPSPWWDDRHHDLTQPGAVDNLGATMDYLRASGLRTWLVVFADVSYSKPVRSTIVDNVIAILRSRLDETFLVEIVNEGLALKPTPFPLAEAQEYASRIKAAFPATLVVVTSPASESCADLRAVSVGDLSAPHYSRSTSGTKGVWTPSTQPWMGDTQPRFCGGRVTLDGESIGIGSSVNSDNDPVRLAMARAVGAGAGNTGDILQSAAGVYGRVAFKDQPGFMEAQEAVRQMRALINTKPDLADWSRGKSTDGPWGVRDFPVDKLGIKGTLSRFYCAWRGQDSWCAALDVRATTTLTAKGGVAVSVRPGQAALTEVDGRRLSAGQSFTLTPATPGAVVIGSAP